MSNEPGLSLGRLVAAERNANASLQAAKNLSEQVSALDAQVKKLQAQLAQSEAMLAALNGRTAAMIGSGPTG